MVAFAGRAGRRAEHSGQGPPRGSCSNAIAPSIRLAWIASMTPSAATTRPRRRARSATTSRSAWRSVDGELYCEGDHDRPFALQSISKVFAYALALADNRPRGRAGAASGVEPSGDAFNSIVLRRALPTARTTRWSTRAPLVTAPTSCAAPARERAIELAARPVHAGRRATGLQVDRSGRLRVASCAPAIATARSRLPAAHAEGMLDGDVEELLALYLHQCSVQVTCARCSRSWGPRWPTGRSTPSRVSGRSRARTSATC